jgi:predicted esterase
VTTDEQRCADGPVPVLLQRPARRHVGHAARGLVVVLHGGAEEDAAPVTGTSRPWLRARLLAAQVTPALHRAGLDVWLLRYREVGWNAGPDTHPAPVRDARWALEQARQRHPRERGVVLLGHSMGARTALAVSDDPLVRGVVGLAPWFPDQEPVGAIAGKDLVALHGRSDTVTSYAETEALLRRAAGVAAHVEMVDMGQRGHTMIDGLRSWNATVRRQVLAMFLR